VADVTRSTEPYVNHMCSQNISHPSVFETAVDAAPPALKRSLKDNRNAALKSRSSTFSADSPAVLRTSSKGPLFHHPVLGPKAALSNGNSTLRLGNEWKSGPFGVAQGRLFRAVLVVG
jgi:hypothetical protein